MKGTISLILVFISICCYGQTVEDTSGIKLFDKGFEFYKKGNFDSTLKIWTEIVEKKIGIHYDTYGYAFFNIPRVYWQLRNYDKAKEWYKKVLASNLRDNDETGSLMEPHTNYKHKSAMALAGLYQLDSNYEEVLKWLNQADTLYRYWGFEGSATNVSEEQAYLLEWKAQVLRKLHKSNEAIRAIITELICSDRNEGFFNKSEDTLMNLIDKVDFKTEFDAAINQLEINKQNDSNWTASFIYHGLEYKIPISSVYPERNLPHYWTTYFINKNSSPDKQKIISYIRGRSFYKRLTS